MDLADDSVCSRMGAGALRGSLRDRGCGRLLPDRDRLGFRADVVEPEPGRFTFGRSSGPQPARSSAMAILT